MKKQLASVILLSAVAGSAQAGFLDFLFGDKSESNEAPAQTAQETTTVAPVITAPTAAPAASTTDTIMKAATGLLPMLTDQLGVSNEQAEGGMGALLQTAQNTLSASDFSSLSEGIPGVEGLLAAAPSLSGGEQSGGLGGLLSQAGGLSESLGSLGQLTQQFEALGLSPDMIIQFAKMAIDYLSGSSSEATEGQDKGALLEKGLAAVIGA